MIQSILVPASPLPAARRPLLLPMDINHSKALTIRIKFIKLHAPAPRIQTNQVSQAQN